MINTQEQETTNTSSNSRTKAMEKRKKAREETEQVINQIYEAYPVRKRDLIDQKMIISRFLDKIVVGEFTVTNLFHQSCLLSLGESKAKEEEGNTKFDSSTVKKMINLLEEIFCIFEDEQVEIVDLVNKAKVHEQDVNKELRVIKKIYAIFSVGFTLIERTEKTNFILTECLQYIVLAAIKIVPLETQLRHAKHHEELDKLVEVLKIGEKIAQDYSIITTGLIEIIDTNGTVKSKLNALLKSCKKTLKHLEYSNGNITKLQVDAIHKDIVEVQSDFFEHISLIKSFLLKIEINT